MLLQYTNLEKLKRIYYLKNMNLRIECVHAMQYFADKLTFIVQMVIRLLDINIYVSVVSRMASVSIIIYFRYILI